MESNPEEYLQYKNRYNTKCQQWRNQPVSQRKVNNPYCIPIFIIFIFLFLGLGIYLIVDKTDISTSTSSNLSFLDKHIEKPITCIFISIILTFIFLILFKQFPQGMIYTLIVISLIIIVIVAIIGLITQNFIITALMVMILLIYICLLVCYRKKLKTGIVIVKVVAKFINEKPIIFLTPVITVILIVGILIFWSFGIFNLISKITIKQSNNESRHLQIVLAFVYGFVFLFWSYIFYYSMVFVISVTCSFWYYKVENKNPILVAYSWIYKSALGALTFASLLVSAVGILTLLVETKRKQTKNPLMACCLCIVQCLLRRLFVFIKILNHNTVICMAVTGQDFIDSAKTAIGLVCSDFPLFSITKLITGLIVIGSEIIIVGIPCIIIIIWMGDQSTLNVLLVVLITMFVTCLISAIINTILVESVSAVLIFYLFDKRFKQLGFSSHNMPEQIYLEFGNAQKELNQTCDRMEQPK